LQTFFRPRSFPRISENVFTKDMFGVCGHQIGFGAFPVCGTKKQWFLEDEKL